MLTDGLKPLGPWLCSFLVFLSCGCASNLRPNPPITMDPGGGNPRYKVTDFEADQKLYRTAVEADHVEVASQIRNRIIFRVRGEIQANYNEFKLRFFENRAKFDTASDWAELALSGAATIVAGERSKTILAAVLTAAKGGRLSVEKNWFREKTTETLISAMQAERDKRWTIIVLKLGADANSYSLDEAWGDLVDFFYAGTLESALSSIAAKTGQQAQESKVEKEDAEKNRAEKITLKSATAEEVESVEGMTDQMGTMTTTRASAILRSYGRQPGSDPIAELDAEKDSLQPGTEKIKALGRAFKLNP